MNKIIVILMISLAGFVSCSKQNEDIIKTKTDYEIVAIRCQKAVVVDGLLDEAFWNEAQKAHLRDSDTGNEVSDSSFSAYALTCYDDKNLYVGFVCNDSDIYSSFTERDQHLWQEEVVEAFIDVDDEPNTYVEIEVSPNNVLFDSYIVDPVNIDVEETSRFDLPGIRTAVSVDGTANLHDDMDVSWTVEIAVPFASMVQDYSPAVLKDAKWRINFYRIDRDADGPVHYAWSPTKGRFHKPSVFGTLRFQ